MVLLAEPNGLNGWLQLRNGLNGSETVSMRLIRSKTRGLVWVLHLCIPIVGNLVLNRRWPELLELVELDVLVLVWNVARWMCLMHRQRLVSSVRRLGWSRLQRLKVIMMHVRIYHSIKPCARKPSWSRAAS